MGGEAYWAGGLHLYTPLPFRPGKGGFGDLFRTHFFLNAGNLCNVNYGGWSAPHTHAQPIKAVGCCTEKEQYGGKDPSSAALCSGEGTRAHLQRLAECIRWSYGAGIVLRLGNIARLELNYCVPMGVQSGDRYALPGCCAFAAR